ncbi:MAG: hypothetical protein KDA28_11300, partial [Phycisphaerales bacterium]|nr:hypothetical protein [Phycisphaerales bacterium]
KRGGDHRPVSLPDGDFGGLDDVDRDPLGFIALDEAMSALERYNERWYDIAMQRFFAGRTIAEVASHAGVSESTVVAQWRLARAWLRREMEGRTDA